jgi:hypothetical protein
MVHAPVIFTLYFLGLRNSLNEIRSGTKHLLHERCVGTDGNLKHVPLFRIVYRTPTVGHTQRKPVA